MTVIIVMVLMMIDYHAYGNKSSYPSYPKPSLSELPRLVIFPCMNFIITYKMEAIL